MQLLYLFVTTMILAVMLNSAQADEFIKIRHGISKRDEETVCLKSRDVCRQMCHIVDFKDGVCVEGEDELCTCNNAGDGFTAPLASDEGLEASDEVVHTVVNKAVTLLHNAEQEGGTTMIVPLEKQ